MLKSYNYFAGDNLTNYTSDLKEEIMYAGM